MVLVILGGVLVYLRWRDRRAHPLEKGDSTWRVEYDVAFKAAERGAFIRAAIPMDTRRIRVYRERYSHFGMATDVVSSTFAVGRDLVGRTRSRGSFRLVATFDLQLGPRRRWRRRPFKRLTTDLRARYLGPSKEVQTDEKKVREILAALQKDAAPGKLVETILAHCAGKLGRAEGPDDAASTLETGSGSLLGRARAMVALCRAAGLPARLVAGFAISQQEKASVRYWTEVYSGGTWLPHDVEAGFSRELPANFLPVRRSGIRIVRINHGATDIQERFKITNIPPPAGIAKKFEGDWTDVLDLTRLPVAMQRTLSLLLLLPVAGLVTAVLRNLVGIRTIGTFTPGLIGLSFVYSDWLTGLYLLIVILAVGFLGRHLLDALRLLMVPRLSVVLTLVVACLALGVSLLHHIGVTPSARAVLLPTVILAITIERFTIVLEEDSARQAFKMLINTLLVAACCFVVIQWGWLGRMVVSYPEGHLFTTAALVWVGRYSGYRLTELARFRDLVRSRQTPAEGS